MDANSPIRADQFERLRAALAPRYRVLSEVGRGGMATVYLADDLKHDRRVAVKELRPELAASLGAERFLREIATAARLAHPHILPLHDSGEAGDLHDSAGGRLLYYTMPYVEGESLRDRMYREGPLPLAESLRLAREVAGALEYAHRHGVVHRDVKPENVLLQDGHALVADFGIARAVARAADPTTGGAPGPGDTLTLAGLAVGTPTHMSPEQASGDRDVDARSDVYSLGVVLYEMLTGSPPFTGPTPQAVLAQKLVEPVPRLRAMREAVPAVVEAAVTRALARAPADRFATAGEMAAALGAEHVPGSSTTAAPPRLDDTSAPAPGAGRAAVAPSTAAPRRRMRRAAFALAVLGVVAAGVVVWQRDGIRSGTRRRSASHAPAAAAERSVAVLPFENLGSTEDEYFPAGITDEITARLGSVSGISVVPRLAAQRYTRSGMTMREIGRKLGVDYLLVGSVRWGEPGSRSRNVRIALELLRARDERQLWATTYERVIDDIFDVQSDIADQVVERLGVALPEDARNRLHARPTANHEAYTLYLKGRYFWNKRTERNIQTGLDYFQRAVDLDPGYSLAWVGIADAWIFRGWYSHLAPREAFPKARAAALKALEFDSTLAEAHASMAHIHFEFDHDWVAAEREYRRAIQLNPRYAIAHHWYGGFLSAMGRHEEALQQAEAARRLDPLSLIVQTWVGLRHYLARRYEVAIAEYLKALELDRNFAPAHWHLGWAYEQTGQIQRAVSEAERASEIDPDNLVYVASLGRAHALAGDAEQARATLARLAQASADRHVSAYHVALIYIALGDVEAGLARLDRAYDEQSPWVAYMRVDPRLDPVRSQPRFERLLRKARLDF